MLSWWGAFLEGLVFHVWVSGTVRRVTSEEFGFWDLCVQVVSCKLGRISHAA